MGVAQMPLKNDSFVLRLFYDIAVLWAPRQIHYSVRYGSNLIHIAAYPPSIRKRAFLIKYLVSGTLAAVRHSAIVQFSGFAHTVPPF